MGSWAADLSKVLAENLEKVGSKSAAKIGEEASPIAYRGLFNPERSFEVHPAAKEIHAAYHNDYVPLKSKIESVETQAAKQHQAMTGTVPNIGEIQKKAAKSASDQVFGENREAIQHMLRTVQDTPMHGKNDADILSDNLNIMFQEEVQKGGFNKGVSKFDQQMMMKHGEEEDVHGLPISKYKGGAGTVKVLGHDIQVEKGVRTVNKLLAWKAAGVHALVAGWNISSEHGYMAVPKAAYELYGPGHEIDNLLASNTISELYINPLKEKIAFDSGKIAKYAPGGIGEFIHKNMYNPGLADVRWHSIAMAAQASKSAAEEAAFRLGKGDTQYAREVFRRMNIDPDKIIDQGYKLHPEDIEKAYYHGSDNKVFLQPYDSTPTFWRQSPLWRGIRAFTGYVTKQAQFKRNLYLSQMKAGDFVGLSRQITLDTLFAPVAAATLYEMERLSMGTDWDHPIDHWKNRIEATPAGAIYDVVAGKASSINAAKMTLNTINMYAKLGAFGTTAGYVRALNRRSMAERFLTPTGNIAIQLGQDAMAVGKTDARHPDAAKPLGRDLLSLVPIVGGAASHRILPTRAEEAKGKVKRPRRSKSVPTDWNPFNYNPDLDF